LWEKNICRKGKEEGGGLPAKPVAGSDRSLDSDARRGRRSARGGARLSCGTGGREGVGPEMVKARCVGGEATGAEVFTYQVCSSLHSF
jgi:hypothetical protein